MERLGPSATAYSDVFLSNLMDEMLAWVWAVGP
jgi:hypothetical protein